MVDAHDDQAINRWMNRVQCGEIVSVIALEGSQRRPGRAASTQVSRREGSARPPILASSAPAGAAGDPHD